MFDHNEGMEMAAEQEVFHYDWYRQRNLKQEQIVLKLVSVLRDYLQHNKHCQYLRTSCFNKLTVV